MTTISSLIVAIGADVSGLDRGLDSADSSISGFASSAGQSLIGTGAKITAITAPLAIFGATGINAASQFESTMAEISARTGVVGTDLDNIRNFALQMGADTSFSGQQAADAFLQLLSSGQSAQEAIMTLPAILDAAAASGEDLGHTADVVTDIMASFGLPIQASADVVNSLAKAAGASSADMGSLGQGFANVGGIAKSFGLDVNRTAAILAVLAENGVKGAEAGTALKSMLLNMTRPTDEVQGEWSALGISFYDNAGAARDLGDVFADLRKVMVNLPAEEQNEVLTTLFGSYGRVAGEALLGSISIEEMEAAMNGSADASTVADARMNTFAGRMDSLRGSVETLMIRALTPFMDDVLSPLAVQLTTIVNGIGDWVEANPELTNVLVGMAAAAVVIGPALVGIGTAMTLAAPAVGVLAAAFGLLISPIGLVAAAVIGLGALIASGVINLDPLAERVQSGLQTLTTGLTLPNVDLNNIQTSILDGFNGLDFSGVQPIMDEHFNDILNTIVSVVGIVFGGPVGMIIGGARLVGMAIENDFLGIGTFLNTSGISTAVNDAMTGLKTTVDSIVQQVFGGGTAAPQVGDGQHQFLTAIVPQDTQAATGPLALFVSDLQRGFDALKNLVTTIWTDLSPHIEDFKTGMQGFFDAFANTDTEGLLRVVTGIGAIIGGIVGGAVQIGADVFGVLLTQVGAALPAFGAAISSLISAVSDVGKGDFGGAATDIGDFVTDMVNSILKFAGIQLTVPDFSAAIEGWRTGLQGIKDVISAIATDITTRVTDFGGGLKNFVIDLITTILQLKAIGAQTLIDLGQGANLLGVDVAAQTKILQDTVAQINDLQSQRYVPAAQAGGVPSLAVGGDISSDGLAYLHSGEKVLTAAQTSAYNNSGGGGAGGGNTIIVNGVQDIDTFLFEMQRRGYAVGKG